MRNAVKKAVLQGSKRAGFFALGDKLTQHGLRILCYHGTALSEEHRFLPKLFMSPQTFERRLRILAEGRYPVLGLADAVERLSTGHLPPRAVVITIDDGFYGTYRLAWPMLQRYGFPATIYSTTYYSVKEHPVFGLVVEYMLWKTRATHLDLDTLAIPLPGRVNLTDPRERRRLAATISEHGETECTEEERVAIARRLGRLLDIDYETLAASRMLSLMTLDELHELAATGADIQAHTHRHRFPAEESEARRELADNRRALEPAVGHRLEHFCYPSGEWFEEQWPWLEADGMRTATTCERGLNYSGTPRLALLRFLDGEHISEIEFEAEVSGFSELLRRTRASFGGGKPRRSWRQPASP
jgi:peptidoglycan/xylan/chitin deacetylase (PgdA/CDA1 family)